MTIQNDLEGEKAAKQTALMNYKALPTKKGKLCHIPAHSFVNSSCSAARGKTSRFGSCDGWRERES